MNEIKTTPFPQLLGKTLSKIEGGTKDDGFMKLTTTEGKHYQFYHDQDCCECVRIEDVCGELSDLIGEPLLQAEEASNLPEPEYQFTDDSHTWTFYRFATIKGSVVVRWLGESNGYYSEHVTLKEVDQ